MNYSRYMRSVILFEEQGRDFAANEDEMKGYMRIETGNNKGALRCVAQNVKHFPRGEYTYKLIFFGKRGERTIHTVIGNLPVNRSGNGEAYLRFHPQNVDGAGNEYSQYTTAIVAAVSSKNEKEPLHPILMGKTGNEVEEGARVNSASVTEDRETEKKEERTEPEGQAQQEEDVPGKQTQEKTEQNQDISQTSSFNYNQFYNKYLLSVCQYFCNVPGYYERVHPFSEDPLEASWLKISNPQSLPLVSPGAQYFAGKYRHFLLGDKNGEMYYLAIPGRFRTEEQPDGGESGFRYWIPVAGSGRDEDAYGYWILGIRGDSGDILSL